MGVMMINFDKEDQFYYQKKGLLYFLCLIAISVLCFEFLFASVSFFYAKLFLDLFIFLVSGPIAFIFVGFKSLSIALPFMLAPLLCLFFVKTETHFKIFIRWFLVYWIAWGIFHFLAHSYS